MLALLLAAAFAGLGYRLVDLQVVRHDALSAEAQKRRQRELLLEPRRGDILDVKGNLLATSLFVKTVCADPTLIGNRYGEVAHAIAPLLQMSENELLQRLVPRLRQNEKGETVTNRYVVLKRKVSTETWQRIQSTMAGLSFGLEGKKLARKDRAFYRDLRQKGVLRAVDDQLRVYPNQSPAAHVLGYVGVDEQGPTETGSCRRRQRRHRAEPQSKLVGMKAGA
jgi:cell division protein FtsI/penicillin-binding protein 2